MLWYNRDMKIERKRSRVVSKVIILLIFVAVLAVVGLIVYIKLYENTFFAERKFEELSRKYYEDSLYENFIVEHDGEELAEAFSGYKNGFTIKLRQILNHEFLQNNVNYRSYFETDSYSCDTNKSTAIFKAHEPYGKKDYDVEFNLVCDKN